MAGQPNSASLRCKTVLGSLFFFNRCHRRSLLANAFTIFKSAM